MVSKNENFDEVLSRALDDISSFAYRNKYLNESIKSSDVKEKIIVNLLNTSPNNSFYTSTIIKIADFINNVNAYIDKFKNIDENIKNKIDIKLLDNWEGYIAVVVERLSRMDDNKNDKNYSITILENLEKLIDNTYKPSILNDMKKIEKEISGEMDKLFKEGVYEFLDVKPLLLTEDAGKNKDSSLVSVNPFEWSINEKISDASIDEEEENREEKDYHPLSFVVNYFNKENDEIKKDVEITSDENGKDEIKFNDFIYKIGDNAKLSFKTDVVTAKKDTNSFNIKHKKGSLETETVKNTFLSTLTYMNEKDDVPFIFNLNMKTPLFVEKMSMVIAGFSDNSFNYKNDPDKYTEMRNRVEDFNVGGISVLAYLKEQNLGSSMDDFWKMQANEVKNVLQELTNQSLSKTLENATGKIAQKSKEENITDENVSSKGKNFSKEVGVENSKDSSSLLKRAEKKHKESEKNLKGANKNYQNQIADKNKADQDLSSIKNLSIKTRENDKVAAGINTNADKIKSEKEDLLKQAESVLYNGYSSSSDEKKKTVTEKQFEKVLNTVIDLGK